MHYRYYNKRPATNDHRLALIPRGFFTGKRVLDVGCNEGIVTCEIGIDSMTVLVFVPEAHFHRSNHTAQRFCAKRVIGVDIDDTLVRAAWKHRRLVWSQQKPTSAPEDGADVHASTNGSATLSHLQEGTGRKRLHISLSQPTETSDADVADYFPVSCEHMFGPLPVPDVASLGRDGADQFPHNVSFRTADWIKNEIPEDSDGYDVVVAYGLYYQNCPSADTSRRFSVSKWIHLNDGDEGLLTFFRRVHHVLRSGGTFILEPQEWDTYSKAKRMSSVSVSFLSYDYDRAVLMQGIETQRECETSQTSSGRL